MSRRTCYINFTWSRSTKGLPIVMFLSLKQRNSLLVICNFASPEFIQSMKKFHSNSFILPTKSWRYFQHKPGLGCWRLEWLKYYECCLWGLVTFPKCSSFLVYHTCLFVMEKVITALLINSVISVSNCYFWIIKILHCTLFTLILTFNTDKEQTVVRVEHVRFATITLVPSNGNSLSHPTVSRYLLPTACPWYWQWSDGCL